MCQVPFGCKAISKLSRPFAYTGDESVAFRADGYRSAKVFVAVACYRSRLALAPVRNDSAAPNDVIGLYLEQIREVASYRDFKIEMHRLHAIVDDIDIFMETAANRAADCKPDGARRDDALLRRDSSIGEVNAQSVMRNIGGVEQLPWFAVSINLPAADQPRIEEIETRIAWPVNLAVMSSDNDAVTLIDHELRWTDLMEK